MTQNEIEALLSRYPSRVREVAAAARAVLKRKLPDIRETVDPSAGLIGYRYGPGYRGLVCTLILSRIGVKLGIVSGAELPDPKGLMSGSGKVHRHVQLRSVADLNRPGLKPLLQRALKAWRMRTAICLALVFVGFGLAPETAQNTAAVSVPDAACER